MSQTTTVAGVIPRIQLDRSRQAAPQVFEHLRGMILSLTLAPMTVLSRVELATQFGVSQTPIRDALIRLGEEGLVDTFAQHETRVSLIDITNARQIHFLRRSTEIEVVRTLANAKNHEGDLLKQLQMALDRQKTVFEAEPGNFEEFLVFDRMFHQLMYTAAGVPDLWGLIRRHSVHLERLRWLHLPTPGKPESILRDHRAILKAIADGKAELAERHMRQHLSGILTNIDEIRTRFPAYLKN